MKATPDKSKTAEARTGNTAEHSRSPTSPTKQQSPPPSEKDVLRSPGSEVAKFKSSQGAFSPPFAPENWLGILIDRRAFFVRRRAAVPSYTGASGFSLPLLQGFA